MCFEFEALYWAKLAEEEEKRKQAEQQPKPAQVKQPKQPVYDEDPLPV
jgi:hypothetical protein